MASVPPLSAPEKAVLKEAVARLEAAKRDLAQSREQTANLERQVEQRMGGFESALNTILRLRGLDPNATQLRYDVMADVWELVVMQAPQIALPFVPTAPANGAEPHEPAIAEPPLKQKSIRPPDRPSLSAKDG